MHAFPGTTGRYQRTNILEFGEALASRNNWTDDFEREGNYWNFEYVAVPRNQFVVDWQELAGLHQQALFLALQLS